MYELSFHLGMPVYKLESEMPYDELLKWMEYFKRRPIGWREDQRTYLFLKTQGVKASAEDMFPTLRMIKETSYYSEGQAALPKGMFLKKMLSAVKGDDSGWTPDWK